MSSSPSTAIQETARITSQAREGRRYVIQVPTELTEHPDVDEKLCRYPLSVYQPDDRSPDETPVVMVVQGMGQPCSDGEFVIPTLLDMGIACVLFDVPFAGERGLLNDSQADVVSQLAPLYDYRLKLSPELFVRIVQVVADDLRFARELAAEQHGLRSPRVALVGVGMGTLFCSFSFLRDGLGERLLGTIGHADLKAFARSYRPWEPDALGTGVARWFGSVVAKLKNKPDVRATHDLASVLDSLTQDNPLAREIDPMSYVSQASENRPMRFLVGGQDNLVLPEDAQACARQFPNGDCYVVPDMGHGGESFAEHVRFFLHTQLGDWQW